MRLKFGLDFFDTKMKLKVDQRLSFCLTRTWLIIEETTTGSGIEKRLFGISRILAGLKFSRSIHSSGHSFIRNPTFEIQVT